jgi:hypothetical protein
MYYVTSLDINAAIDSLGVEAPSSMDKYLNLLSNGK